MTNESQSDLRIEATQSSPSIVAEWGRGVITMRGESYPENSFSIYEQILDWLDQFLEKTEAPLSLDLELNYLNTSSVRAMIELFDRLEAASQAGRSVAVRWRYDTRNPRAAELGEELREDYAFPFAILALEP
jgi:hypothetical protein